LEKKILYFASAIILLIITIASIYLYTTNIPIEFDPIGKEPSLDTGIIPPYSDITTFPPQLLYSKGLFIALDGASGHRIGYLANPSQENSTS